MILSENEINIYKDNINKIHELYLAFLSFDESAKEYFEWDNLNTDDKKLKSIFQRSDRLNFVKMILRKEQ